MPVVPFARSEPDFIAPSASLSIPSRFGTAENKLRAYGRAMRLFFGFVFAGWMILQIGCLLSLFLHFRSGIVVGEIDGTLAFKFWPLLNYFSPNHALSNVFMPYDFPLLVSVSYAVIFVIASAPFCASLLYLMELFSLYSHGEVFARRNTTLMRRIGHSVMATGYAPFLLGPVAHEIGVLKPITGVTDGMIAFVFLGLILLAISHVMDIGERLRQDQEEIL